MDIADRIKKLRTLKGWSQRKLSIESGLSPEYINRIESKKITNLGIESVESIAAAFGVHASVLHYGGKVALEDPAQEAIFAGKMPVIGYTTGGPTDCHWLDGYPQGGGMEQIDRPVDLSSDAYALRIKGDSMAPKYEEGETVIVDPDKEYKNGDYAVVRLKTGEVMLKKISIMDGHIILSSINSSYNQILCKKKDIEFIHPVVYSKRKP
jgi:phage repressor protein C with HTH and peptisase S24 domain